MTNRATTQKSPETRPALGTILRKGLTGLAIAILVNALLYLVGTTFTFPDTAIAPTGAPVTLAPVLIVTAMGGLTAIVGFFVLTRFLTMRLVNWIMWGATAIALLAMAINPFGITDVPMAEIVILEIMHLVAAVPVFFLTRS